MKQESNWKLYDIKKKFKNNKFSVLINKERKAVVQSFDSVVELINCYEENYLSGKWKSNATHTPNPAKDETPAAREERMKVKDRWAFGDLTMKETYITLMQATASDTRIKMMENEKEKIYANFPELIELEKMAVLNKRRKSFRMDGDEIDVDRYLIGESEQWIGRDIQKAIKRTAKIQYDMPTSASNDPSAFVKNMAFIAAFVDIIELGGIACEVWLSATGVNVTTSDDEKYTCTEVCLKKADDALDVQKLLSAGNPGLFRQYFFAVWDNITITQGAYGLGQAINHATLEENYADYFNADVLVKASDFWSNRGQVEASIANIRKIYEQESIQYEEKEEEFF